MQQKYISAKTLKDKYPFTVPEGYLMAIVTDQAMSNGVQIPHIVFKTPEDTFAVNGYARASGKYRDYQEIWGEHPKKKGLKVPTTKVMELGLELLKKERPDIYEALT